MLVAELTHRPAGTRQTAAYRAIMCVALLPFALPVQARHRDLDRAGSDTVDPRCVVGVADGRDFSNLGAYHTVDKWRLRWGRIFRSESMLADPTLSKAPAIDLRRDVYAELPYQFKCRYRAQFKTPQVNDGRAAFKCSADEYRTGVTAALALTALGVLREAVTADYVLPNRLVDPDNTLALGTEAGAATRRTAAARSSIARLIDAAIPRIVQRLVSVDAHIHYGSAVAPVERARLHTLYPPETVPVVLLTLEKSPRDLRGNATQGGRRVIYRLCSMERLSLDDFATLDRLWFRSLVGLRSPRERLREPFPWPSDAASYVSQQNNMFDVGHLLVALAPSDARETRALTAIERRPGGWRRYLDRERGVSARNIQTLRLWYLA